MQNLTVQKVVLALITLGFFVGAPWLTSETLGGNPLPLTALGAIAVLLLFVYGLGNRCWLLIPFCLSIEGNLNFLPLNFSMQELAILTVFSYLLFRMIFGMDVAWRLGPAILWIPWLGVLAVLLYHWISSGDIGIKLLGGTGWGGRRYFAVFLSFLSVPLLASFPGISFKDLQKVPFIYFLGSFFDIVPDLLTTLVPAAAPLIWKIYSGVNLSEYGSFLQGNFGGEQAITRFRTLSKLGISLGLVLLSYVPPQTWLSPTRLWAFPMLMAGGLLCALSGFRGTIFNYGLGLFSGLFATLRLKALAVLPLVGIAVFGIALSQGRGVNYPSQIQRALSFLPGKWDLKAQSEASGSSKWRKRIVELFYLEYFGQAPILGQGYHFDPNLAKQDTDVYLAIAARQAAAGDEFADVRRFIEQRMPHEGPIHILLVTGVVGMTFFASYCAALLGYSVSSIWNCRPTQVTPIQIWAFAIIVPAVFSFFLIFGEYTTFFTRITPVVVLLYRFERLKAFAQAAPTIAGEAHPAEASPTLPWHDAHAGWQRQQPPAS